MGDPHKNVWGGKNNSWGHKKKNQQDNSYHYEPNKLFNTIAGGCLLFLAGALGLSMITSAISGIKGVKDTVDTTKDVVEHIQNNTTNQDTNNSDKGSVQRTNILDEFDIELDEEDIQEILEDIYNSLKQNNAADKTVDNIVVIDYAEANSFKLYKKNIINKLSSYKDIITFAIVNKEPLSSEDITTKVNELQQLISDNINELSGTGFTKTVTGGKINMPALGNFIFTVTFLAE